MGQSKSTAHERQHLARVAGLGCIICRATGHHDPTAHHAGITTPHHVVEGYKRLGHWYVIPLCHAHHQGADGFHRGPADWQKRHGSQANLLRSTYDLLGYPMPKAVAEWIRIKTAGDYPLAG